MAYEIDYIPVGEGEKSGDCIAMRFWDSIIGVSSQKIIVIDGGFKDSGETLVEHIKKYYGSDFIDLVISTHPDSDHSSGLSVVLENLRVGQLAMHRPWEHANKIKDLFKNKNITINGLENKIEKGLQSVSDLEDIATRKGIEIVEPFQGITGFNGVLKILGPSIDYYRILLANFRATPEPIKSVGMLNSIFTATKEVKKLINDFLHIDLLDDDEDTTSAENNSSTIILFNIDNHKILFTGDSGKTGLLNAINYAEENGISLENIDFFDVPHHGSKRNINSKIIKHLRPKLSYISASGENEKHPAKKVVNGLIKHGANVYINKKNTLLHHNGGIDRGWSSVTPEEFNTIVEE